MYALSNPRRIQQSEDPFNHYLPKVPLQYDFPTQENRAEPLGSNPSTSPTNPNRTPSPILSKANPASNPPLATPPRSQTNRITSTSNSSSIPPCSVHRVPQLSIHRIPGHHISPHPISSHTGPLSVQASARNECYARKWDSLYPALPAH